MKKYLLIPVLFLFVIQFQNCTSDDPEPEHADGHIHGTVSFHHDDVRTNGEEPVEGATVEMWFNSNGADGAADFTATTDAFGEYEFEELEAGIYYISASATVDANLVEGSALVEITEAAHEISADIELQ